VGQRYEPEDIGSVLAYREALDGQILEEGISEAGALASWTAAATSHSVHGLPMLPFYIYYSMFGFQRVGDQIWAAADQRVRGFLLGATAGRTTLGGEGLQHQDGHSLLVAAQLPNCRAWEPASAGELAVILHHGMVQMLEQRQDVFHYIALFNQNQPQPSLPAGVEADVVRGLYRVAGAPGAQVRLLGSGPLLAEVRAAADLLLADWGVAAEVFSATSYAELEREARAAERAARLHPLAPAAPTQLTRLLPGATPIVAASDWVRAWPGLIAPHLEARMTILGTDGFGRSDTRAALRGFFEIDRRQIVLAALRMLDPARAAEAIVRYGIDVAAGAPWER
jgi:pyruvate dehydrogenase E1 component